MVKNPENGRLNNLKDLVLNVLTYFVVGKKWTGFQRNSLVTAIIVLLSGQAIILLISILHTMVLASNPEKNKISAAFHITPQKKGREYGRN